jgi:hypothetical protein
MTATMLALFRVRSLELPTSLLVYPCVVLCLYVVFRWRKFGEDDYTWNHSYFRYACGVGAIVWLIAFLVGWFTEPWEIGLCWLVAAVVGTLVLSRWTATDWLRTILLALLIAGVGVLAMPAQRWIGWALYHPVKVRYRPSVLDGVPISRFVFQPPAGWREIPNQRPRTYRRDAAGSGVFQVSLLPPVEPSISASGEAAEQTLAKMLDEVGKDMDLGQRLSLTHEPCATGFLATARHQTAQHGLICFWLIQTHAPPHTAVFATYTDGGAPAQEEIAQFQQALKTASWDK